MKCLIPLLILLATVVSQPGHAQSFDCRKAETDTEWAICNTPELGKLDAEVAEVYGKLTAAAANAPSFRRELEDKQISWARGAREACYARIECLAKVYQTRLNELQDLVRYDAAQTAVAQAAETSIVPRCDPPIQTSDSSLPPVVFAKIVCGSTELLTALQRTETLVQKIRPRLSDSWRVAFDAQQAAFPKTPYNCPTDHAKLTECVATAVKQRLQDVEDFAANRDKPLPKCKPSEVSIKDSEISDAGMSQSITTYLIEYHGSAACQLRGYPTILVYTGKDKPAWTYAAYSGGTYFSSLATPPLPVTLSARNRTAWFGIHTASGCDPLPAGTSLSVKVALPLSQDWLRTIEFPYATCPTITVTPVGMISTLLSSIN